LICEYGERERNVSWWQFLEACIEVGRCEAFYGCFWRL
jgi:hypothetical protein